MKVALIGAELEENPGLRYIGLSSPIELHPSFSPVTPYILNSLQIGDCSISS